MLARHEHNILLFGCFNQPNVIYQKKEPINEWNLESKCK